MKYTFFCILIFALSFTTTAQQNHFLYFQTEAKQPFYIKLDNKIFNSSSSGYLVVPKLKEGNYKLTFGFPKNEWPDQTTNYTLGKDAGYLLKNFSDKGWGLFDLQSLNVIMADKELADNNTNQQEVKKDNFSEMLATVVNDSTILQKDVAVKKEAKEPPKEKITDSVKPVVPDKEIVQLPDTAARVLYSVITKNLQLKSKGGMEMIYLDEYNNNKDTIRIFIPFEEAKEKKELKQPDVTKIETKANTANSTSQPAETTKVENKADSNNNIQAPANAINIENKISSAQLQADAIKLANKIDSINNITSQSETIKVENKADNNIQHQPIINLPLESATNDNQKKDTTTTVAKEDKLEFLPARAGMVNSNCKQQATEDDFLKLRKKMAAEDNDDDMINAAKKVFRTKCFITKNIKNLGTLFLNDHGRYNFFDAAYSYVSDSDIFPTLVNQLTDEYYINRFKAMIHQ